MIGTHYQGLTSVWFVIENFSYWSIRDRVVYRIIWTVTFLRTKLLIICVYKVWLLWYNSWDRLCRKIESSTGALIFLCGITSRDWAFIDSVVKAVDYSRQADIALSQTTWPYPQNIGLPYTVSSREFIKHKLRTFRIPQNANEGHVTFRVCIAISALHLSQFC